MRGEKFLQEVWGRTPVWGVGPLVIRDHAHHWDERFLGVREIPEKYEEGAYATYFCPNMFETKRKRDQCLQCTYLWQDLDEVHPLSCDPRPTLSWSTSPGRYQALWLLTGSLNPIEAEGMNRLLNRKVKADKGTWNLTRLLRVPGSYNGKRGCQVTHAQGDLDDDWYLQTEMREILNWDPSRLKKGGSGYILLDSVDPVPVNQPIEDIRRKWSKRLNPHTRRLLFATAPDGHDRSVVAYKLGGMLLKEGVDYDDAFHLLWNSAWGEKYKRRPQEIHRILQKHLAGREEVNE